MRIANGMEFVNDSRVIGKWRNIGKFIGIDGYMVKKLKKSDEFKDLYFLPNGEAYWIFEGWTKDFLLIHHGGNEPLLTYHYEIRDIDENQYLYLRLEQDTEVFVKESDEEYNIDTIGRHDDMLLPFVADDDVIGKWYSVGFVAQKDDFNSQNINTGLYLKMIEFFSDGRAMQEYMDKIWNDSWTKGFLLNAHRKTAAQYDIQVIDGREYLFLEWKMGNYIYGGKDPEYYVFSR